MAVQIGADVVIDDNKNLTNIVGANGRYDSFYPNVDVVSSGSLININMNTPFMDLDLGENANLSVTNKALGKTAVLLLDTQTNPYVPNFDNDVKWPADTEPTWGDHRYWTVALVCWDAINVRATAVGYDS